MLLPDLKGCPPQGPCFEEGIPSIFCESLDFFLTYGLWSGFILW